MLFQELYDYRDCPLAQDHIRLLFLKPHEGDRTSEVEVELATCSIQQIAETPQQHQYTALSSNWGDDEESKIVFVQQSQPLLKDLAAKDMTTLTDVVKEVQRRRKRLAVRPNLYAFLQEFRQQEKEVALWVYRICINQKDVSEKQDQVSRMAAIYSMAASVSIWLGSADKDRKIDRAMDFVSHLLDGSNMADKLTVIYATHWTELLYLLRRRWFSRRWIIQELALAKNAEVRCGTKRKHWRDFADAFSIFALHFDAIIRLIKGRTELEKALEGIKDIKPLGARIFIDVLANTFQRHADGTIYAPRQTLESLISSLSSFETSDPRDTVYTLLNLAKETITLSPNNPGNPLATRGKRKRSPPPVPDYTVDLLEVCTTFMKWCIQESGSLDILLRHWALPELKQRSDEHYPRLVELPSWIKTVRGSAFGSQAEGFGGRRTGDSFVGTPENRYYNASLGMKPDAHTR
ncbi:heterokaryon incompatibility protein-domain-containing protein [Lasiosphaeria ovina]|uniref:Heterokaryon incompatibility protein-domain-containing protein n=1 Tax=Lasiosphaeria ovina TaxID=92902 RepID=A0AAE0MYG3_9PEZI|nr:heterokaryon incompatibility protein-domain-containing protein [Lasiosphaeria ovina]